MVELVLEAPDDGVPAVDEVRVLPAHANERLPHGDERREPCRTQVPVVVLAVAPGDRLVDQADLAEVARSFHHHAARVHLDPPPAKEVLEGHELLAGDPGGAPSGPEEDARHRDGRVGVRLERAHLQPELRREPLVVVVEERDQLSSGGHHARVVRASGARRPVVRHDADRPSVGDDHRWLEGLLAIEHDDALDGPGVVLRQHASDGGRHQLVAVVRGDDDRDGRPRGRGSDRRPIGGRGSLVGDPAGSHGWYPYLRKRGLVSSETILRWRGFIADLHSSSRRSCSEPWCIRTGLPMTVWLTPSRTRPSAMNA